MVEKDRNKGSWMQYGDKRVWRGVLKGAEGVKDVGYDVRVGYSRTGHWGQRKEKGRSKG